MIEELTPPIRDVIEKSERMLVFDINNLSYLLKDNNITTLTIDWQTIKSNIKTRAIQYSTIDRDGILASYTTMCVQKDNNKPKISNDAQTLQVYSSKQLREMLERNGFKVMEQCGIDGKKFVESKTDRIVMVAKKQAL